MRPACSRRCAARFGHGGGRRRGRQRRLKRRRELGCPCPCGHGHGHWHRHGHGHGHARARARALWGEVAAGLPNRGESSCRRGALAAAAARRRQRVAERAANASTAKHVKPCVEVGGGLLEDVHVPGFVRYA